jgi:LPS export ABC transporter permease LptG
MRFRPRILPLFLAKRFFFSVMTVMLLILGVICVITFMEKLPGASSALNASFEAAIQMLELLPLFLPMIVFMGTLLTAYNLTRSAELVIISSSGMSPYDTLKPSLWVAGVIGLIAALGINPYSVRLSTADINANKLVLVDDAIWLREASEKGTVILRARDMNRDGERLVFKNATVFQQGAESKLTARIEADDIILSDNKFTSGAAHIYLPDGTFETAKNWQIDTLLNTQTVLERYLKPSQISFWRLPKFILDMHKIGVTPRGHLIQFWTLLLLPLTLISMVVLGFAFSQTHERRNFNFGIKFSIGIVTCFALYFIMNVFNALGVSGGLPTFLSVIAPPIIIIAGGALFIVSYDTI